MKRLLAAAALILLVVEGGRVGHRRLLAPALGEAVAEARSVDGGEPLLQVRVDRPQQQAARIIR